MAAPGEARRRQEPLRRARQVLGAARTRAAEERGAAMSRDTAAEYAEQCLRPVDEQEGSYPPDHLQTSSKIGAPTPVGRGRFGESD